MLMLFLIWLSLSVNILKIILVYVVLNCVVVWCVDVFFFCSLIV